MLRLTKASTTGSCATTPANSATIPPERLPNTSPRLLRKGAGTISSSTFPTEQRAARASLRGGRPDCLGDERPRLAIISVSWQRANLSSAQSNSPLSVTYGNFASSSARSLLKACSRSICKASWSHDSPWPEAPISVPGHDRHELTNALFRLPLAFRSIDHAAPLQEQIVNAPKHARSPQRVRSLRGCASFCVSK
jgi:hypothetical protein